MELHQHINIQVNVPRKETKAERELRAWQNFARGLERMWQNKIDYEKAAGNPLFQNITTLDQYREACEEDDKRKKAQRRKELGFWRYHFFG